jgi:hypothetical protein
MSDCNHTFVFRPDVLAFQCAKCKDYFEPDTVVGNIQAEVEGLQQDLAKSQERGKELETELKDNDQIFKKADQLIGDLEKDRDLWRAEALRLRDIVLPIGRLVTGNTEGLVEASNAQDKAVEYYRSSKKAERQEGEG